MCCRGLMFVGRGSDGKIDVTIGDTKKQEQLLAINNDDANDRALEIAQREAKDVEERMENRMK